MLFFTILGICLIDPISETAQLNPLGADPTLMGMVPQAKEICSFTIAAQFILYALNKFIRRKLENKETTFANQLPQICICACIIFLILTRAMQFSFGSDDSYIFFRYADNIRHGLGPVYNAGERILGFSSYTYMALLCLANSIVGHVVVAAKLLDLTLQIGSFWLLYSLGSRVWSNRWLTVLALFLFSLSPFLISEQARMQETALVCFLMLASLLAFQKGNKTLVAWTGAIIFLTRLEGVFWLVVSALASLIQNTGNSTLSGAGWKPALPPEATPSEANTAHPPTELPEQTPLLQELALSPTALPEETPLKEPAHPRVEIAQDTQHPEDSALSRETTLPRKRHLSWVAFRRTALQWAAPAGLIALVYLAVFAYFKTVLPHGAVAKMKTFYNVPWFMSPGDVLVGIVRTCFDLPGAGSIISDHPILSIVQIPAWQIAITFTEALALLVLGAVLSRKRAWLAIYFYSISLIALFLARAPVMFSWYLSWFALIPSFFVPTLIEETANRRNGFKFFGTVSPYAVSLILVYEIALPFWQYPVNTAGAPSPFFMFPENQDKMIAYKQIGEFANQPYSGKYIPESLAAFEIGQIGYAYKGRMIDLGGLTSEEVLQYYPVPPEMRSDSSIWSTPPKAVLAMNPEFVVVTRNYEKKGLLRDQEFLSKFKKVKTWPTSMGPIDLYTRSKYSGEWSIIRDLNH